MRRGPCECISKHATCMENRCCGSAFAHEHCVLAVFNFFLAAHSLTSAACSGKDPNARQKKHTEWRWPLNSIIPAGECRADKKGFQIKEVGVRWHSAGSRHELGLHHSIS